MKKSLITLKPVFVASHQVRLMQASLATKTKDSYDHENLDLKNNLLS